MASFCSNQKKREEEREEMRRVFQPFSTASFEALLRTKTFGRPTIYQHTIPSTQKALVESVSRSSSLDPNQVSPSPSFNALTKPSVACMTRNSNSFPDGACLVADFQTQGKGLIVSLSPSFTQQNTETTMMGSERSRIKRMDES